MNRLALCLLLLVAAAFADTNCTLPKSVVRVDAENRRLFVIGTAAQLDRASKAQSFLKPLSSYIHRCHSDWTDWAVSVFADRQLAKYKDELQGQEAERWANAYAAEYSSREQRLVLHPLSPNSKRMKLNE